MAKRSTITFAGLMSTILTYYVLASILGDAIYVFFPQLYEIFMNVIGVLALLFVALSFIYAIKERNWPIIIFFFIIFVLALLR